MQIDKIKLQLLLAEKELSAKDLAEMAEISPQTISKIIKNGRSKPKTIGKIAKALGVEPAELVVF